MQYIIFAWIFFTILALPAVAADIHPRIVGWQSLGLTLQEAQKAVRQRPPLSVALPLQSLIVTNAVFDPTAYTEKTVCMTPDKKLFFICANNRLMAFEASTGRRLWQRTDKMYYGDILALGSKLLVGAKGFKTRSVVVLEPLTGHTLKELDNVDMLPRVSADGIYVGLMDFNGGAKALKLETLDIVSCNTTTDENAFWKQYGIEINNSWDNTVSSYQTPHYFSAKPYLPAQLYTLAVSSQGVVALAGKGPYLFTLSTRNGSVTAHRLPNTAGVAALCYSENGKLLFVMTAEGALHIYLDGKWQHHDFNIKEPQRIVSNDDGTRLWVSAHDTLYSIELPSLQHNTLSLPDGLQGLAFSQKHRRAIALIDTGKTVCPPEKVAFVRKIPCVASMVWHDGDALLIDSPVFSAGFESEEVDLLAFASDTLLLRRGSTAFMNTSTYMIRLSADSSSHTPRLSRPAELKMGFDAVADRAFLSSDGKVCAFLRKANCSAEFPALSVVALFRNAAWPLFSISGDDQRHAGGFRDAAFDRSSATLITLGTDHDVSLWQMHSGQPELLLSYIFFQDGNYLVTSPLGHFDVAQPEALKVLHWINSTQPGQSIPFEHYSAQYHRPNLAQTTIRKADLPQKRTAQKKISAW